MKSRITYIIKLNSNKTSAIGIIFEDSFTFEDKHDIAHQGKEYSNKLDFVFTNKMEDRVIKTDFSQILATEVVQIWKLQNFFH